MGPQALAMPLTYPLGFPQFTLSAIAVAYSPQLTLVVAEPLKGLWALLGLLYPVNLIFIWIQLLYRLKI